MTKGIAHFNYFNKYYSGRSPQDYEWILAELDFLNIKSPVLDLGCGSGLLLDLFYEKNIEAIGVEASIDGVKIAINRNPNLKIINQNLNSTIEFPNDFFGLIILNQVIEHLNTETQIHVLKESFRLLKKNGALVIYSPSFYNIKEHFADPTHINLLTPRVLKKRLYNSGFQKILDNNKESINLQKVSLKIHYLVQYTSTKIGLKIMSPTSNFIAIK